MPRKRVEVRIIRRYEPDEDRMVEGVLSWIERALADPAVPDDASADPHGEPIPFPARRRLPRRQVPPSARAA